VAILVQRVKFISETHGTRFTIGSTTGSPTQIDSTYQPNNDTDCDSLLIDQKVGPRDIFLIID